MIRQKYIQLLTKENTNMATMLEIQARLNADKNKKEKQQNGISGDGASYQFWNIPEGKEATVRFLPDKDEDNVFFWVEKQTIRMPFEGVNGGENSTDKQVSVTVPCVDMFGMACPIMAETRPWWNDEAKKDLARLYYKKRSWIFQGFVVNSPIEEQNVPENPIRIFVINKSIYEIVERSLANPEFEMNPTDMVAGRDFKIAKTKKGDYANYGTSSWSFKTRALTEKELLGIDQYGLFNLKDRLGRVPDSDELEAIKAMFHDSLAGNPFDMASYGKWYRPYGIGREDSNDETVSRTVSQPASRVSEPVSRTVSEETTAPSSGKQSPHDILEQIKKRAMKNNAA